MILGHVLSGLLCGIATVILAALAGFSWWQVAVAYTGAGSVGILLSAWLAYRASAKDDGRRLKDQSSEDSFTRPYKVGR
jgi:hypothetical protein